MKTLCSTTKKNIAIFIGLMCSFICHAQIKGMYVDVFGSYILVNLNASLRSNLIAYAAANNFNYLILYDMESFVLSRDNLQTGTTLNATQQKLSDFIFDAKNAIPGLQIGVAGGALKTDSATVLSVFFDNVKWYNNIVNNTNRAIDVIHLEEEYWNNSGSNFLLNKLAFEDEFIPQLSHMRTIANNSSNPHLIVETYLGRFDKTFNVNNPSDPLNISEQAQADSIDPLVDRVLLHIYMPNKFIQPRIDANGYNNLQFEFDYGYGERFKAFAGNSTPTTILPLFSAESANMIPDPFNNVNFYGDYLWFNDIRTNGQPWDSSSTNAIGYELKYINDLNQPFIDFNYCYQNNIDPYGPNPNWGNPCIPFHSSACHFNFIQSPDSNTFEFRRETLVAGSTYSWDFGDSQSASGTTVTHTYVTPGTYTVCMAETTSTGAICQFCTNVIASGTGSTMIGCTNNIIGGHTWFKYGSLPLKDNFKPLYIDLGPDLIGYPGSSVTLHPTEFAGAIATAISYSIPILQYDWYVNGEWEATTFPASPDFQTFYSTNNLQVDIVTCDLVTDLNPPIANRYRYRDDIKLTADVTTSSNLSYYSIITTPATCPNYNNGTAQLYLYHIPPGMYSWDGASFTSQTTITGLSDGPHNLIATNLPTTSLTFNIPRSENMPRPFIYQSSPYFSCDNVLMVNNIYSNYRWSRNGVEVQNGNSNSYIASQNGIFIVEVTDISSCTGQSAPFILNMTPSTVITTLNPCLNTEFIISAVDNDSRYVWTVPNGVSYTQNGNRISVTWGSAYSTGGTITSTVTNACGGTDIDSILVIPFLATTNSTYTCPGLSNGTATISELTGGTPPYLYQWNSGTNSTSQSMSNLSSGTYTVTVTDHTNCTATASTTVNNFPTSLPAPIVAGPTSDYPGAQLYTITNYNSAYDNFYTWSVIPNSGNATISYPNSNNQSANITWPSLGGWIVVSLGLPGCMQTATYVVPGFDPTPPNPKHPDPVYPELFIIPTTESISRPEILFDQQLNITKSGISPSQIKSSEVIHSYILYPNPTTGKISLNYNLLSSENGLLQITNTLGVTLYSKKLNPESQHLEIDLSEMNPAIYYFKIIVDYKQIRQGMISIVR